MDTVTKTSSDDVAALELAAMRSVLDAFLGRTVQSADAAAAVLAHPRCPRPRGSWRRGRWLRPAGCRAALMGLTKSAMD